MSIKENFLQAARELMSGTPQPAMAYSTVPAGPELRSNLIKEASLFSSRRESGGERKDYYESAAPDEPVEFTARPFIPERDARSSEPEPAPRPSEPERDSRRTVLAEGTVVHGSVSSASAIELHGEVYGDILSQEDLTLTGKLEGNASGRNIDLRGGRIKGNIQATGRVRLDSESIVLGNIRAGTLLLNGRVKGNLDIKDSVALDVNAAVAGNVIAGKLSIAEGAMLQGEVRISSADLSKLFAGETGPAEPPRERPFTPPVYQPEPKAEPIPEPQPEPQPEIQPEPKAEPQPEPEPKAKAKPEADAQSTSKPELKPDFVALLNKLSADKAAAEKPAPEADKPE